MTTVRHTNGDYLTTSTLPTMTGAFSIGGCLKNNAHSSGTEVTMFGLCNTGGSSEGIVLSTGLSAAGTLTALAFNAGGGNQVSRTVYTGSYTGWLYWLIRHKAGSASYQVSWRFENDTAWQTVTLTLPAQITVPSGQMRLGSSIFDLHATDCSSHHFYCKESYLTDTQALTASRALGTAPSGTNLHYLALTSAATASTNGGTAANWTPTGALTDDASTPSESSLPSTYYAGSGPVAYGSTSVQAVWPEDVGLAAGDYIDYVIGTKPDTATIASPGAGWTLVKETSGGGGTTGADAGPTKVAVYRLTALAAGTETGNGPSVAITSGNSSWGFMRVVRTSLGGGFSYGSCGGTDATTGAAWSVTGDADPGLQNDDVVLVASCVPTDVTTPDQFTAYGVTATGVSSWSAFREIVEPDSTTGNDVGGFSFSGRVTGGTSSAAPVITATASGTTTNVRGPSVLVRVRGLSGTTNLTPPLLSAASSLLAPALAIALAAPLLSASSALLLPTITQAGDITPPLLSASSSLLEPTVSVALQAPLLSASSTLLEPTVQQAMAPQPVPVYPVVPGEFNRRLPPFWPPSEIPRSTVIFARPAELTPPLLSATSSLLEPRVDVALAAPLLAASPSLPIPAVSVALSAPLLSASPSLPAPSVAVVLAAPLLSAAPSLPVPRIDVAVAPSTLAASSVLLAPALAVQLQAPLLSAAPSLLAPTVEQAQELTPPLLSAASTLLAPTLTIALAPPVLAASPSLLLPAVSQEGFVSPPVLVAASALLAPSVSVALAAPLLTAAPSFPAASVGVGLQAPLLAAAPALLTPHVDVSLQAPTLTGSSSLLTPGVTVALQAPLLSATSSLLVPTVEQELPGEIRPPLLVATSYLLAPTLAIDIQAVLLVASSQLLLPTIGNPLPSVRAIPMRSSAPAGPVPLHSGAAASPIPMRSASPVGPIKVR